MSVILAIEAGGEQASAALCINGDIRQRCAPHMPHSQFALPMVRQLLDEAGITLSRCDAFAFGAGPGRFSGLRLACGIVQSFAYAVVRPGVAVDSLAALAHANFGDKDGADNISIWKDKKRQRGRGIPSACRAAIPAHRGHIFTANCRHTNRWRSPRPMLMAVEDFIPAKRTTHFCGEGFARYPQLLQNIDGRYCDKAAYADAAAVCALAVVMLQDGETAAAADCQPRYIRRQVAQTIAGRAKAGC